VSKVSKGADSHGILKLAIVQPVLAPIQRSFLERMNECPDLSLKVFVTTHGLKHRRTWHVKPKEKFVVEVIEGLVLGQGKMDQKTGGFGSRPVPYNIYTAIRRFRPHAVIVTNATELLCVLPCRWFGGTRLGLAVEDTNHTISFLSPLIRILKKQIYRMADFFLPHGEQAEEYLRTLHIPKAKIGKAHWSVDNGPYLKIPRPRKRSAHEPNQWISVGALIPRKGFNELLEAWSHQGPEFLSSNRLVIVGEGPEEKTLNEMARRTCSSSVEFSGHRTPEELVNMYAESDIFVFPTLRDHWGLVVNEAMAAGLPVICSKYAGCSSDLVRGTNGAIFDPKIPWEFENTLRTFCSNRKRWEPMGMASRQIISEYTIDTRVHAFLTATRKAVQQK